MTREAGSLAPPRLPGGVRSVGAQLGKRHGDPLVAGVAGGRAPLAHRCRARGLAARAIPDRHSHWMQVMSGVSAVLAPRAIPVSGHLSLPRNLAPRVGRKAPT